MRESNSRTNTLVAIAGLCGLLALPSIGLAEADAPMSIEALALMTANSPAEHEALAAYFRAKAADARDVVRTHRRMAKSLLSKSPGAETAMQSHCSRLADAAEKEAVEYDALAALQDEEAKVAAK